MKLYKESSCIRSFKLLQLPCVRTLKYYIDFNLEEVEEVEKRLLENKTQYDNLVALAREKVSSKVLRLDDEEDSSELLPIGEGSLVIDEVKVRSMMLHYFRNVFFLKYVHGLKASLFNKENYLLAL